MPFTLSHPATAVPFAFLPRRFVCMTGLIVGSIVPDFEYFFRMEMKSNYSHTTPGLFYFCLPIGLLLCFLFHNVIRDSLINSLPRFLKARFYSYNIVGFDWNRYFIRRWFVILPSILVGAWLHILGDGFTHSALQDYQLQYFSTLFGAIVILATIWFMPRNRNITGGINVRYWTIFAILFAAIMLICFRVFNLRFDINAAWYILINRPISHASHIALGHVAANAMSAIFISLTITSLVCKMFSERRIIYERS